MVEGHLEKMVTQWLAYEGIFYLTSKMTELEMFA